jgi:inner membrane protein
VASSFFMNVVDSNAFHRTVSHSLIFFILASPILGWLISRIHSSALATRRDWTILAFLAMFTHALLDCFTTWGTQLFWPLPQKVAWQSIFVIDPFYTLPLLVFLILALVKPTHSPTRSRLNYLGLGISSAYLLLTLLVKEKVNDIVLNEVERQNIPYVRMETRPAPLNIILWGSTIETREGYYTGYYSLLDENTQIDFLFHPKNHDLLRQLPENTQIKKLKDMSEGWYVVRGEWEREREGEGERIIFSDLRFGTNNAWEPGGEFIFSYTLTYINGEEVSITQNERKFREEPGELMEKLFSRVMGEK